MDGDMCLTIYVDSFFLQVTFLPLLSEPCSFDLLVYTNKAAKVPKKWEDSDPRYIMNSQEVKLRSFTTSVSLQIAICYLIVFVSCVDNVAAANLFHPSVVSYTDSQSGLNGHVQGGR